MGNKLSVTVVLLSWPFLSNDGIAQPTFANSGQKFGNGQSFEIAIGDLDNAATSMLLWNNNTME